MSPFCKEFLLLLWACCEAYNQAYTHKRQIESRSVGIAGITAIRDLAVSYKSQYDV